MSYLMVCNCLCEALEFGPYKASIILRIVQQLQTIVGHAESVILLKTVLTK